MHPGAGSIIDLLVRLPRAVAALPPTPVPGLVSPPPSSKAQPTVLRRAYRQRRSDGGSRASRRGGAVGGWQGPRRGLGCVTSCVRTWSGRPGSPRHCRDGQPSSRGRRVPRRGSAVTDRPDESLHPPSATRCVSRPHGVCGRSPHKAEARRPRYDLRHVEKHRDYRDERRAAGRSGVAPKAGFDSEFWLTCDTEFGPPPILDDVPASDVASGVVAVYLSAQDFALR